MFQSQFQISRVRVFAFSGAVSSPSITSLGLRHHRPSTIRPFDWQDFLWSCGGVTGCSFDGVETGLIIADLTGKLFTTHTTPTPESAWAIPKPHHIFFISPAIHSIIKRPHLPSQGRQIEPAFTQFRWLNPSVSQLRYSETSDFITSYLAQTSTVLRDSRLVVTSAYRAL